MIWFHAFPRPPRFQTLDWQRPLLQHDARRGSMRLLRVFRGEQAIAIVPLRERRERLESPGRAQRLSRPLIDPTAFETAWRAILSALRPWRAS